MDKAQRHDTPQKGANEPTVETVAGSAGAPIPEPVSDSAEIGLDPDITQRDNTQRLGEQISRAIIQTGACWTTDVIDPPLSKFLQDRFGKGTDNKTVWFAEILGDSVGGAIYVGIKQAANFMGKLPLLNKIGNPIDAVTVKVKNQFDESLTKSGQKALKHWSEENHIDQNDPRYQRKLENYKYHQAEAQVDSFIVAASAGITNVVAQKKLFGNQNQWKMIGISKLCGSVATLTLMAALNRLLPNSMHKLESEMSDKYFSPVANAVKGSIGLKDDSTAVEPVPVSESQKSRKSHGTVPVLETGIAATVTAMAVTKIHDHEAELVELLPKSLGIGAIAAGAIIGIRALVPESFRTFNKELYTRYTSKLPWIGAGKEEGHSKEDAPALPAPEKAAAQPAPILAHDKRERFMASLQRSYAAHGGQDIKAFVADQKRVCQAFVQAFVPQGRFSKTVAAEYAVALRAAGAQQPDSINATVDDMLLHRRDAMLARLKLLDDPAFTSELEATLKSGKALIPAAGVSPEKKEKLIVELAHTKGSDVQEAIQKKAHDRVLEQKALLAILEPQGAACRVLTESLASQLDPSTAKNAGTIAANYLAERQEAARNVIITLAPEGEVVKEAIMRAQPARPKSTMSWQDKFATQAAASSIETSLSA